MKSSFPLSPKYIDFINTVENVDADFLEGTTAAGKTTVGVGVKFMRMVSRSKKSFHIIAAKTTGVAEKNIIQQDNGILDIHKDAQYFGNGDKNNKIPHIKFEGKIIYVLGYDNKSKWQLVLGGQYGCVYIDEVNTADIEFVREMSTRNEYLMATLNPDNPMLPVYKEFINRSRPYQKYASDVPEEIMRDLVEPVVPNWRYWFFSFKDNASLTAEDIEKKKRSAPPGTKLYKNKIQGLRGKATGLVFMNFDMKKHTIKSGYIKERIMDNEIKFVKFTAGLDTAYSANSPDTIAMIYQGITDKGVLYTLDEKVYNNAELQTPIAPSDTVHRFIEFLERNRETWGFAKDVFIDSADQATITELNKYKRQHGSLYNFTNAYKKTTIIDRINLQVGWIAEDSYFVCDHCKHHLFELNNYSWKEDKDEPEDSNDHTINANQYAWLPYKHLIGRRE
ncbi:PBSX family phage terminase, large subunit [Enterococcus sp. AZ103]